MRLSKGFADSRQGFAVLKRMWGARQSEWSDINGRGMSGRCLHG